MDAAACLRSRLRHDLTEAMRRKASGQTAVLRTLLAAIDNAEAVAVGTLHDRYAVARFGDGAAEVPRRHLSVDELQELLRRERDERLKASAELDARGQGDRAAQLIAEARLVEDYLE